MKLFLDIKSRRFVKSAASNVALTTLVLKRRDQVSLEIVFVANNAVATPPTGTTATVALKRSFADTTFLALAAPGTDTLDLFTEPVEAAFSSNPASIPALLEVRWGAPGESLRTATLQVELQNSVILGTEGTPSAIPDLKATQAQAEAGTDNTRWLTPLRTFQAIASWVASNLSWSTLIGKPATFPPSAHEHTASEITDFEEAVIAAAPPTTDASLLTSGTLDDARLSSEVTSALAFAATAVQPAALSAESAARADADTALQTALAGKAPASHGHAISEIDGLANEINRVEEAATAADTALGQRIDLLAENLDTESLDSIAEAAARINSLQEQIDGKANLDPTHPQQGAAEKATQLWDLASDAVALRIIDGNVDFGPYTAATNLKENFRTAIGAASTSEVATLTAALDGKEPLLWDFSFYDYQTGAQDDIPIAARRRQRLEIRVYSAKANGATLTLPRRTVDGALDGDELEITVSLPYIGVTGTIHIRQYVFTGFSYVADTSLLQTIVRANPQPPATFLYRLRGGVWVRVPASEHTHTISDISNLQSSLDSKASTSALASVESSLGTLALQSAEAVEILGGSAHFDTLSAGNDHAAEAGYLTVAANGDLLGTGANRILGFIAGGATY